MGSLDALNNGWPVAPQVQDIYDHRDSPGYAFATYGDHTPGKDPMEDMNWRIWEIDADNFAHGNDGTYAKDTYGLGASSSWWEDTGGLMFIEAVGAIVASAFAGPLGTAAGIGATATGALTGAAVGAGTAAINGADTEGIITGGVLGGVTGGAGSYVSGLSSGLDTFGNSMASASGGTTGGTTGGLLSGASGLNTYGNSMSLAGGAEGVPESAYLGAYNAANAAPYTGVGSLNYKPDYYNGAGLGSDYASGSPSPTPDYYNGAELGSSYGLNTGNPTPDYYNGAGLGSANGFSTDTSIDYLSKAKDLAKEYGPDVAKKLLKLATNGAEVDSSNGMMGTILPAAIPAIAANWKGVTGNVSSPQAAQAIQANTFNPSSMKLADLGWNNLNKSISTKIGNVSNKPASLVYTLAEEAKKKKLEELKAKNYLAGMQNIPQEYLQGYLA